MLSRSETKGSPQDERETARAPTRRPAKPVISSQTPAKAPSLAVVPAASPRVASVDALRGFSMLLILGADLVAGGIRQMLEPAGPPLATIGKFIGKQFTHAEWHGAYFWDLLFPMFIFVVGVSIVFSLPKLVEREGKWAAHKRIFRRFVLLFALGVFCYGGVADGWSEVRLGGVLQRIALCYLFASLLFINTGLRGMTVALVGLLIGYWALMTFVPVPGVGAGSYAQNANLANWIDANYLPGRKWQGTWDPEGILSTLPAIATCLLGIFAGLLLKNPKLDGTAKTRWLIGAGIVLVAAGLLWSLQFPINKYLWTSSFVLVAGGFAALMLGVLHEIIDVRGYRAWAAAFMWVGASAITLYIFNFVAGFYPLAERVIGGDVAGLADTWLAPGAGQFFTALLGLAMAVAAARFLYQRRIFLRV
jgi:predicted acyltransferase